jgi:hypothetical protein
MLANGARLDYQVKDDTGGGSGGPVAELVGRMDIGRSPFRFDAPIKMKEVVSPTGACRISVVWRF